MAENMTESDLYNYRLAFSHYDVDNSGTINFQELKLVVEELGHNVNEAELSAMMHEMDCDANGSIDFSEFLAMMAKRLMLSDYEQEVLEAFKVLDKDGNGELSADELTSLLTTLGEKLTPEECLEILKLADEDGDGKINYREFVKLLLGN